MCMPRLTVVEQLLPGRRLVGGTGKAGEAVEAPVAVIARRPTVHGTTAAASLHLPRFANVLRSPSIKLRGLRNTVTFRMMFEKAATGRHVPG